MAKPLKVAWPALSVIYCYLQRLVWRVFMSGVSLHFLLYGKLRFWGSAQHNITVINNGWQGEHSEMESNDGHSSQEMALKAYSQPSGLSLPLRPKVDENAMKLSILSLIHFVYSI